MKIEGPKIRILRYCAEKCYYRNPTYNIANPWHPPTWWWGFEARSYDRNYPVFWARVRYYYWEVLGVDYPTGIESSEVRKADQLFRRHVNGKNSSRR